MVIHRDKDYMLYVAIELFLCVALLFLYVFGCDMTIGFALLFNSPVYVIVILELISAGRTFIMDEEGCTVCFWRFRKKYTWTELRTKKIEEYYLPSITDGKLRCPYTKEAFAAPYKIRKPRMIRSNLYSLLYPFSFIYVNFSLKNKNWKTGRYYEIDEGIFRQKMKDWDVDWVE